MNKWICLIPMLASLCFGDLIETVIDFEIPKEGWDHASATLISVNLKSILDARHEGRNYNIESATLKLTDVQNLREPENDDILNLCLLQLNNPSGSDPYHVTIFEDGVDNEQHSSNFFEITKDNPEFNWVEGSYLESYTDDNDNFGEDGGAWVKTAKCRAETKHFSKKGEEYYYVEWVDDGNFYSDWGWWPKYDNGGEGYGYGLWQHLEDYTTDTLYRYLDVATVKSIMDASEGWIGGGIDADCKYQGNISLMVQTSNVPEPTSLSFLLLGFVSLTGAYFSRKRK